MLFIIEPDIDKISIYTRLENLLFWANNEGIE